MRTAIGMSLLALVTAVHGFLVVGATLSLPIVLFFPWTRQLYLVSIGIILLSWMLFSDCPLTTLDQRIRSYLHWPRLHIDFTSHYFTALTGVQLSRRAHLYAERIYLLVVIAVILIR